MFGFTLESLIYLEFIWVCYVSYGSNSGFPLLPTPPAPPAGWYWKLKSDLVLPGLLSRVGEGSCGEPGYGCGGRWQRNEDEDEQGLGWHLNLVGI